MSKDFKHGHTHGNSEYPRTLKAVKEKQGRDSMSKHTLGTALARTEMRNDANSVTACINPR